MGDWGRRQNIGSVVTGSASVARIIARNESSILTGVAIVGEAWLNQLTFAMLGSVKVDGDVHTMYQKRIGPREGSRDYTQSSLLTLLNLQLNCQLPLQNRLARRDRKYLLLKADGIGA